MGAVIDHQTYPPAPTKFYHAPSTTVHYVLTPFRRSWATTEALEPISPYFGHLIPSRGTWRSHSLGYVPLTTDFASKINPSGVWPEG